ncbi:hypothetical protein H6790_01960 [Candidatus Nomurabacteria bacterium]|nr:hypothetical protein [Candidatus Nomurabacteria bacterium]
MKNQKKKDWWYRKIGGIHKQLKRLKVAQYIDTFERSAGISEDVVVFDIYRSGTHYRYNVYKSNLPTKKIHALTQGASVKMLVYEDSSVEEVVESMLGVYDNYIFCTSKEKVVSDTLYKHGIEVKEASHEEDCALGIDIYLGKDQIPVQLTTDVNKAKRCLRLRPKVAVLVYSTFTTEERLVECAKQLIQSYKEGVVKIIQA